MVRVLDEYGQMWEVKPGDPAWELVQGLMTHPAPALLRETIITGKLIEVGEPPKWRPGSLGWSAKRAVLRMHDLYECYMILTKRGGDGSPKLSGEV